jgi:hypothetical protein
MDWGDSDFGNPSRRRSDDSDTDARLASERETQTLQFLADNLQKDNAVRRAQLQQAVGVASGMEELHQRKRGLAGAVRALEAAKSDLSRRLEIALRAGEELAARLGDERQSAAQQQAAQARASGRSARPRGSAARGPQIGAGAPRARRRGGRRAGGAAEQSLCEHNRPPDALRVALLQRALPGRGRGGRVSRAPAAAARAARGRR